MERAILAPLRDRVLLSFEEMNGAIQAFQPELDGRPMAGYGECRRGRFARERPSVRPLPARPYEWARWSERKVAPNDHAKFERKWYWVPWRHAGARVRVRATARTVEIFAPSEYGERLCYHSRYTSTFLQDCFGGIGAAVLRIPQFSGLISWAGRSATYDAQDALVVPNSMAFPTAEPLLPGKRKRRIPATSAACSDHRNLAKSHPRVQE